MKREVVGMNPWDKYKRDVDIDAQKHQSSPLYVVPIVGFIAGATYLSNRFFISSSHWTIWLPVLLGVLAGVVSLISYYLPQKMYNAAAFLQIFDIALYGAAAVALARLTPFPHNLMFWVLYMLACQLWAKDGFSLITLLRVVVLPALPLLFFEPPELDVVILLFANLLFFIITSHAMTHVKYLERKRWETDYMLRQMASLTEHTKTQLKIANQAALGLVLHDFKNKLSPMVMFIDTMDEVVRTLEQERNPTAPVLRENITMGEGALKSILDQVAGILSDVAQERVKRDSFSLFKLEKALRNLEHGIVYLDRLEEMERLKAILTVASFPMAELPGTIDDVMMIIINLIQNAVSAGATKVDIAAMELPTQPPSLSISVTNNGEAIPKKMIENLFLPFTSGRKNGTGLGLYFARQWMESIQGQIRLRETRSTHTCFEIIFPILQPDTKPDK